MENLDKETALKLYRDDNIVVLATTNDLNDFAQSWDGNNTNFTLKQLAADLVPYEHKRADDMGSIVYGFFVSVGTIISFVSIVLLFVFYGHNPENFGEAVVTFGAAFLLWAILTVGVGITPGLLANEWVERFSYIKSRGPIHEKVLNRFAEALEIACCHLELDIHALVLNGRKKVLQLASDRLVAWAVEIVQLEQERDEAPTPKEFLEKEESVRNLRTSLQLRYDAFAALKLEGRGYPAIFSEAHRILAEQRAA